MARSFRILAMALVSALGAACAQPSVPRVTAHATPTRPPAATATMPAATTALAPAAPRKLQRPAGDVQVLAGTVAIDGGYLSSSGQGSLVSEHGAGLVANNGSTILAIAGAGKLLSNNGSSVVANNAGNVVADAQGNVVADAAAGAAFGLLEAALAPATGDLTPVAGMRISVTDLGTGKPLALGDGGVTSVYSNALGRFELYLPRAVAGNVRVDVGLPGKPDPHLALELLTPLGRSGDTTIDEDSSMASHLVRVSYAGKLTEMLDSLLVQGKDPKTVAAAVMLPEYLNTSPGLAFQALLKDVRDRGQGKGWTSTQARDLAERLTDRVLAKMDLDQLKTAPPNARQVMPVLTEAVRQTRLHAARLMATDPHFFDKPPYDAADPHIVKAAEVPNYIVQTYFVHLDNKEATVPISVLITGGFSPAEARVFYDDVFDCCVAMVDTLGLLFMADEGVQGELSAALDAR
jgi:hypothetical protein